MQSQTTPYLHSDCSILTHFCYEAGMRDVILCPGSRSAPLTLAFQAHGKFQLHSVVDERSAAYIALGMAQSKNQTVIVVCTSGTAAANFLSAVSEAYFLEVPLLLLTADRPSDWIGQQDGQTIYQKNIFGSHVKFFGDIPTDRFPPDAQKAYQRMVHQAIYATQSAPLGPAHLNFPFREPLYPSIDQDIPFPKPSSALVPNLKPKLQPSQEQIELIESLWEEARSAMCVLGQSFSAPQTDIFHELGIVCIGDIISNTHKDPSVFCLQDLFLGGKSLQDPSFSPDLLFSVEGSFISKNLKVYLRKHPPKAHVRIDVDGRYIDVFQGVTHILSLDYQGFTSILKKLKPKTSLTLYSLWKEAESKAQSILSEYFQTHPYSELSILKTILTSAPEGIHLHLSNSMSVRYVNSLPQNLRKNLGLIFSNRGTSGIDGCTSTCVGHALGVPEKNHWLITGDVAFFYDSNAFWNARPSNIKIVLLNNQGGQIFKMIPGPSSQKEALPFFTTPHERTAEFFCKENGLEYFVGTDLDSLEISLKAFCSIKQAAVLEIRTNPSLVSSDWSILKQYWLS